MANVRKVTLPSGKLVWRAAVMSSEGKRRSKNFSRKGDAEAWCRTNDRTGANGSTTMTLAELAADHNRWFVGLVRAGDRGQRTADGYDSHLHVHLKADKAVADLRLSELDGPALQNFLGRLIERTGSTETARRVKKSLSAWCSHGQRHGWLKHNPVDGCKVVEKRRRSGQSFVIPSKDALSALLAAAEAGPFPVRDCAIANLLIFSGLRISELLGLADEEVHLARSGGTIRIKERLCSRHVTLGDVKSENGLREIPIGPATAAAIKAWRLARGPAAGGIVEGARVVGRLFPAPDGLRYGPFWAYQDFRRQCWYPLMQRAGLGATSPDKQGVGRPVSEFGPHTLRHVYASIQIESGVTPKKLQTLLGHATLAMTMDLYGHLWTDPTGDQAMAEAAERSIPRRA